MCAPWLYALLPMMMGLLACLCAPREDWRGRFHLAPAPIAPSLEGDSSSPLSISANCIPTSLKPWWSFDVMGAGSGVASRHVSGGVGAAAGAVISRVMSGAHGHPPLLWLGLATGGSGRDPLAARQASLGPRGGSGRAHEANGRQTWRSARLTSRN